MSRLRVLAASLVNLRKWLYQKRVLASWGARSGPNILALAGQLEALDAVHSDLVGVREP
jgi:hypothetical protein